MLSKDAKQYLKEVKKTGTKRQSIFSEIEDDIMGLYDEGLTYDQIWDYTKTKINNMPKSKNSLVNFIQVRLKKRKKLAANNPQIDVKNNQKKEVQKIENKEPKTETNSIDQQATSSLYDDMLKLAKERKEINDNN